MLFIRYWNDGTMIKIEKIIANRLVFANRKHSQANVSEKLKLKPGELKKLRKIAKKSFEQKDMKLKNFMKYDFFVLKNGKAIVGFFVVSGKRLCLMAIEPGHRRKGIGSFAMNFIKRKYKNLFLMVKSRNKDAIKFYEKHGWKKIRLVRNYYKHGWKHAVRMAI